MDTARTGERTRRAGGADQRGQGRGRRKSFPVHGRNRRPAPRRSQPPRSSCRCCRTSRAAGSGRINVGIGAAYQAPAPPLWTRRLDAVFLHPVAGPADLPGGGRGVFQTIFSRRAAADGRLASADRDLRPMDRRRAAGFGIFRSLLVEGVWNGVGSVIVFLPQILLLFLFIGILEDSGYLARAALIADRTMARFGLAGKSVHSAAVGLRLRGAGHHGDAHHREQARPHGDHPDRAVHDLLGAAAGLHPDHRRVHPGAAACSGRCSARRLARCWASTCWDSWRRIVTARLLKSSVLKSERTPFMLEMPPYRMAHAAVAGPAADRPRQGLPAPRRHCDSAGRDRAVDARASAAAKTARRPTSPTASPA